MRRPLNGARRVTGDTASHARRGVGPATDYGADAGEPVFAPFAGWVTHWWSDTGGWSVAITDATWKVTMQHNSGYRGPSSGRVSEGTNIAVVGSTGNATSGPHVHTWVERVNGSGRLSLEDWLRIYGGFTNTASKGGRVPGPYSTGTAGGGGAEIIEEVEEVERMVYIIKSVKDDLGTNIWPNGLYVVTPNGVVGAEVSSQSVINRLNGDPGGSAVELFSSEVAALNGRLRAGATSAPVIDVVALAKAIAPLVNVSGAPTAQENATAVKVELGHIPTADEIATVTRTKIIKE